jgi:hypothetical protein
LVFGLIVKLHWQDAAERPEKQGVFLMDSPPWFVSHLCLTMKKMLLVIHPLPGFLGGSRWQN